MLPSTSSVPPDTPRESNAAVVPELDAPNSRSNSIHTPSAIASREQTGFLNERVVQPEQDLGSTGSAGLTDAGQTLQLSNDRANEFSTGRPRSCYGEGQRRLDSMQRGLQGHDRRVVADSATILSFADVRGSIND